MNYIGDNHKSEYEYQQALKDRKKDAKLRMQQTAKIINGEIRAGIFDGVVGVAKPVVKKTND